MFIDLDQAEIVYIKICCSKDLSRGNKNFRKNLVSKLDLALEVKVDDDDE